jgi:hypothetical protein
MDQEPVDQSSGTAEAKPKLFQNINGVIAGLTGLVVAAGGLVAAYTGLKPDNKPVEEPIEQAAPNDQAAQQAVGTNAPADTAAEVEYPILYTGDTRDGISVKIEFDDNEWVLTEGRGTPYTYVEMLSSDEKVLKAFDKDTGYYLRWPINGGLVEESQDDEDYDPYADVKPSD